MVQRWGTWTWTNKQGNEPRSIRNHQHESVSGDGVTDPGTTLLTGAHYQMATQGQIMGEMLFIAPILFCYPEQTQTPDSLLLMSSCLCYPRFPPSFNQPLVSERLQANATEARQTSFYPCLWLFKKSSLNITQQKVSVAWTSLVRGFRPVLLLKAPLQALELFGSEHLQPDSHVRYK